MGRRKGSAYKSCHGSGSGRNRSTFVDLSAPCGHESPISLILLEVDNDIRTDSLSVPGQIPWKTDVY